MDQELSPKSSVCPSLGSSTAWIWEGVDAWRPRRCWHGARWSGRRGPRGCKGISAVEGAALRRTLFHPRLWPLRYTLSKAKPKAIST